MNGKAIEEGKLVLNVSKFMPPGERASSKDAFNNLFVKNLPTDFTEEQLKV